MDWRQLIGAEKQQPYFIELLQKVQQQRDNGVAIYPPKEQVFNAFRLTPAEQVKVVILGQDPYHGPGQAHGLSFSVPEGVKFPPSLRNIYKAIAQDYPQAQLPRHGDLSHWAEQGVLLLNTVLTVEQGKAHSHASWGWERFTDKVVEAINEHLSGVVFLLWGSHAQRKAAMVDSTKHCVLHAPHPSPLSAHRGFFEAQHFIKANEYLTSQGKAAIVWAENAP
ncbi:uracil-DNA glycosylase [Idiomarina tyrosinivorans]|uniref:Uracil-DNA glycosylase n=1 Tax=Idiomarina tyrosinivorans TaxID=1445662 RepID=A0A432ZQW7_9GAMM|nr:uracil-DNA glycosylase [Idiomarina tyrosinivorans]RUO80325.1 uracil-DNA glycosylase [Idiomarina tyrosinivorans]